MCSEVNSACLFIQFNLGYPFFVALDYTLSGLRARPRGVKKITFLVNVITISPRFYKFYHSCSSCTNPDVLRTDPCEATWFCFEADRPTTELTKSREGLPSWLELSVVQESQLTWCISSVPLSFSFLIAQLTTSNRSQIQILSQLSHTHLPTQVRVTMSFIIVKHTQAIIRKSCHLKPQMSCLSPQPWKPKVNASFNILAEKLTSV